MIKSLIKVTIGIAALYVAKKVVYKKIVYPAIQDVQDAFNEQLANINRIADSFIFDSSFMNEINEELIANSNNMFDQAVTTTNQMIEDAHRNMEMIQQQQNDVLFMQQMQQPMMF